MQRYAENSFALGDYSKGILEIYLNLAKTDSQNQKHYFNGPTPLRYSENNPINHNCEFIGFILL